MIKLIQKLNYLYFINMQKKLCVLNFFLSSIHLSFMYILILPKENDRNISLKSLLLNVDFQTLYITIKSRNRIPQTNSSL